jgi:hypothetical protein
LRHASLWADPRLLPSPVLHQQQRAAELQVLRLTGSPLCLHCLQAAAAAAAAGVGKAGQGWVAAGPVTWGSHAGSRLGGSPHCCASSAACSGSSCASPSTTCACTAQAAPQCSIGSECARKRAKDRKKESMTEDRKRKRGQAPTCKAELAPACCAATLQHPAPRSLGSTFL